MNHKTIILIALFGMFLMPHHHLYSQSKVGTTALPFLGIFDGTVAWNLKTKENLDVAPGIYFYVVKSSIGNKEGKIAVIK